MSDTVNCHKFSQGCTRDISANTEYQPQLKYLNGASFVIDSTFKSCLKLILPDLSPTCPPVKFKVVVQNSTVAFDTGTYYDYSSCVLSPSQMIFPAPSQSISVGCGSFTISTVFLPTSDIRWKIEGTILRDYNV